MWRLILLGFVVILAAFGIEQETIKIPSKETTVNTSQHQVITVIDGDTLIVNTPEGQEKVRLIGIDTPEVDPSRTKPECYGTEASARTKELIAGKIVTLTSDPSQGEYDEYGRLLSYVLLEDGSILNHILVAEGYAREFTYNTPYRYQKEFQAAEVTAKQNSLGLWGVCRN